MKLFHCVLCPKIAICYFIKMMRKSCIIDVLHRDPPCMSEVCGGTAELVCCAVSGSGVSKFFISQLLCVVVCSVCSCVVCGVCSGCVSI